LHGLVNRHRIRAHLVERLPPFGVGAQLAAGRDARILPVRRVVQRLQHLARVGEERLLRNDLLVLGDLAHAGGVLLSQPGADVGLPLSERLARLVPRALVPDVVVQAATLVVRLHEVAAKLAHRGNDGLGYFQLVKFGRCRIELLVQINELSIGDIPTMVLGARTAAQDHVVARHAEHGFSTRGAGRGALIFRHGCVVLSSPPHKLYEERGIDFGSLR